MTAFTDTSIKPADGTDGISAILTSHRRAFVLSKLDTWESHVVKGDAIRNNDIPMQFNIC